MPQIKSSPLQAMLLDSLFGTPAVESCSCHEVAFGLEGLRQGNL